MESQFINFVGERRRDDADKLERLMQQARDLQSRIEYADELLEGFKHAGTVQGVAVSNPAAALKRRKPVANFAPTTKHGEFAGVTQPKIVQELLRRAPDQTLHINDIMSDAKAAGVTFIRQSLQSMMSRHKEMFRSVETGSGKWTLVNKAERETVRPVPDLFPPQEESQPD